MKISTKLRRERKQLRNSNKRKIAIDLETRRLARGLAAAERIEIRVAPLEAMPYPEGFWRGELIILGMGPRRIPRSNFGEVLLAQMPPLSQSLMQIVEGVNLELFRRRKEF
jgi:hypothetical protein